MTTGELFKQTNAYAMQLGGIFGLYWCFGLMCMLAGFNLPLLHAIYPLVLIVAPFIGLTFARRFEKQVREDMPVDFSRAYMFSFMMYIYAIVILASVAYVYFRLFDNGAFVEANIAMLQTPEMQELLNLPQMKSQIDQILGQTGFSSLEELFRQGVTPITIAANIIDMNLILAFIFSMPTAFLARTKRTNL